MDIVGVSVKESRFCNDVSAPSAHPRSATAGLAPPFLPLQLMKKNVPRHILAPRRGCFGNHLLLRRVRILVARFIS